jgi:plastocyanin
MYFLQIKRSLGILALAVLINILSLNISFAKTIDVNVSNSKFTPKDITVSVGDSVKWTETEGTHNVDGLKSVYPNNPVSFGNSIGNNWSYTFVFTVAGKYNYQCDAHVSFGMTGTVTVETTSDVNESQSAANPPLIVYPNPAAETITISDLQFNSNSNTLKIYNNLGENVLTAERTANMINISELPAGVYYLMIDNRTVCFTKSN